MFKLIYFSWIIKQVLTTYLNHESASWNLPELVSNEESWSWPVWGSNPRSRGCEADTLSIRPRSFILQYGSPTCSPIHLACPVLPILQTVFTIVKLLKEWHSPVKKYLDITSTRPVNWTTPHEALYKKVNNLEVNKYALLISEEPSFIVSKFQVSSFNIVKIWKMFKKCPVVALICSGYSTRCL